MTELGMPGADIRDPRVSAFLTHAINQTNGDEEALKAYIAERWT